MKFLTQKLLLIILTGLLFSCEEGIQLDISQAPPQFVIEGLVTDQMDRHYVKLSESVSFYDKDLTPKISTATVEIRDSEGNVFSHVHNPNNHPDSIGYYLPLIPYQGKIGNSYTLIVDLNGTTYTAMDNLLPVTKIDSLSIRIDEDELDDPDDEGRFYEILFYAIEPQDTKDFYLFKFYRNGELVKDSPEDIYYTDDDVLGETISDVTTAGYYAEGETGTVEIYSLSRAAFVYYFDLESVINNDGGMFSQPPVNPRTNLSNGALGFFQTSAMDKMSIMVEP